MLGNIKKKFVRSLLAPGGWGKLCNLAAFQLTYPRARHVLGGGVNVIHRCNLRCPFCSCGFNDPARHRPDMPLALFERILDLEAFRHAFYIVTGDGEPLLLSDFDRYIQAIQKRRKLALVPTNATLLEKRLDTVLKAPPDIMWVSLYDQYEERQLAGLGVMQKHKPAGMVLGAAKLITKDNLHDLERIIALVGGLGVENIFFQQLMTQPEDHEGQARLIFDNDRESLAVIARARAFARRQHPRMNIFFPHPVPTGGRKFFCLSLYKGFQVEPSGAIQPCCVLYPDGQDTWGNIFNDPLTHCHHPAHLHLKRSFLNARKIEDLMPVCQKCPMLNLKV